ncbi:MAG: hypothetical protein IKB38_08755 [Clostridia bacterium]|nr:hypothetical protein [Clostridia bacterium]
MVKMKADGCSRLKYQSPEIELFIKLEGDVISTSGKDEDQGEWDEQSTNVRSSNPNLFYL